MKRTIVAFIVGLGMGWVAIGNAEPEPRQPEMPEPPYVTRSIPTTVVTIPVATTIPACIKEGEG